MYDFGYRLEAEFEPPPHWRRVWIRALQKRSRNKSRRDICPNCNGYELLQVGWRLLFSGACCRLLKKCCCVLRRGMACWALSWSSSKGCSSFVSRWGPMMACSDSQSLSENCETRQLRWHRPRPKTQRELGRMAVSTELPAPSKGAPSAETLRRKVESYQASPSLKHGLVGTEHAWCLLTASAASTSGEN